MKQHFYLSQHLLFPKVVCEQAMRVSEQGVRLITATLNRKSYPVGTMVQAIDVANHDAVDYKNRIDGNCSSRAISQQHQLLGWNGGGRIERIANIHH